MDDPDDFETNDFENYLDPNRNSSTVGREGRSSTKNKMRRTIKAIRQPSIIENQ